MKILVDSSVWIDIFKSGDEAHELNGLIENNLIFTNDIILTELIPFLKFKRQADLIDVMSHVARFPLAIDWLQIQLSQYNCLKAGINGIGIPDLIIAQNAVENDSRIYALDKHFHLMQPVLQYELYV